MTAADRIAREAARLFETGQVASIRAAISAAAERTGLEDCLWPSEGRVRQHLQALAMQSLGEAGYRQRVRGVLTAAEQLMTVLAEMIEGATPMLVGRAARGHVDGPTRLHVRLYTESSIEALARTLVDLGYDEPQFDTANTRFGRLNRLLLDDDGVQIVLTRCPLPLREMADRNLFTGETLATATLEEVRELLAKWSEA